MRSTTGDNIEKEAWHSQVIEACEQQRYIFDTKNLWEPIMRAAAGEIQAQEVIQKWQKDWTDDKQQAAQQ